MTEGVKKADAAAVAGLCCVALPGVWSWRGSNDHGGKVAIPDWHDVALNGRRVVLAFDSDVSRKQSVRAALDALAGYLTTKGAHVEYAHLPDDDGGKTGLDDYLVEHDVDELWRLVKPDPPAVVEQPSNALAEPTRSPKAVPVSRADVYAAFRRWLGADYDLDVLDAVLCVVASEQLTGDPAWLLVVSGSGAAKTETVVPLAGAGANVTSTITSEGALLSGTAQRERTKDATGGLLRKVGERGVLVVKDMTSILSMSGDARASVLAALREVYDGLWERNMGVDGGRSLTWRGRLVVIGAVTTAWDTAHSVVAAMGDRFLLVRLDSTAGRVQSGRQAIGNAGSETTMRAELSAAVGGLLGTVDTKVDLTLDDAEVDRLLILADVVTLTRTAVMRDYKGDVLDAHAPEMPTRFAKQLAQVVRGGLALGMPRGEALRIATRCARDSMPPLRFAILLDVLDNPAGTTREIRQRVDKPRNTVDRELQGLHMLGLVSVDEVEQGDTRTVWHYSLASTDHEQALKLMRGIRDDPRPGVVPFLAPHKHVTHKEGCLTDTDGPHKGVADSGTTLAAVPVPTPPGTSYSDASTTEPEPAGPAAEPEPGRTKVDRLWAAATAVCEHGVVDGDQPDAFVGGRLRCPECREARAS